MECVKELAPEARCEVVPNGVDCEKFYFKEDGEEQASTLVFAGNFKYGPNRHAVEYFLREIFPMISAEVPETRFLAVGNGASHYLAKYEDKGKGFAVIDFVPALRPYVASATVALAPLTVGAGVSNKLLEGFATGTAVVATPLACGDLPVKNGEHLLIGSDAKEFARNVIVLLKRRELRTRLAKQARRLVEEHYDWETVYGKLERVIEEAAERKAGTRRAMLVVTA